MSTEVVHYDTDAELVEAFAPALAQQLNEAIEQRGAAYLVVSGGRTPIALFSALRKVELPWNKVTILLADDRWVPANHADSNERLVREHLLQDQAAEAQFIGLVDALNDCTQDAETAHEKLNALPTFDVVILGMGDDSHTASLFPCSADLTIGLHGNVAALAVTPTTAPHYRISMSKRRLLDTRQLYVHLKGASKEKVIEQALQGEVTDERPISHFVHQSVAPTTILLAQE